MINAMFRAVFLLVFRSIALILAVLASVLFFVIYAQTELLLFYYVAVGFIAVVAYLGVSVLWEYKRLLSVDWLRSEEPLEVDSPEVSLRICACYAQGATYERIKEDFKLSDNTQVLRNIRGGLRLLLKSYSATHGLNTVTNHSSLKEAKTQ